MTDGSCERVVEAISARLDGEAAGIADAVVDAHLTRCGPCREFAASAAAVHRRVRVRTATAVPDQRDAIMAAIGRPPPRRRHRRPRRPRTRRASTLIALGAAAAVAAASVSVAVLDGHRGAGAPPTAGASITSARYPGATILASPAPKPTLVLTDTADQRYDLAAATATTVTLVYFGYTHCPDLCPLTMAITARALRDMPVAQRRRVTVVFVTTDPARDSPTRIRAWLDTFDPSFVGLTGPPASLRRAEQQVGMPLSYAEDAATTGGGYAVVHAGYSLIYSQDGVAHLQVDPTIAAGSLATTLDHLVTSGYRTA